MGKKLLLGKTIGSTYKSGRKQSRWENDTLRDGHPFACLRIRVKKRDQSILATGRGKLFSLTRVD